MISIIRNLYNRIHNKKISPSITDEVTFHCTMCNAHSNYSSKSNYLSCRNCKLLVENNGIKYM